MSTRHARFVLPIASLVLVAACSGGAATSSPAPVAAPPTPADLNGRAFLSTDVAGATLVPGSQVRLTFEGDTLGAQAGCNSMGGSYAIQGGILQIGPMMTTEMACEEPLMAQDQWLSSFLDGATIALDGSTLSLAREGVTLTLQDREVADPDRPLVGTRWILESLVSNDAVSSVPAGVTATLTFTEDRVDVEAGCNTGSAPVTVSATTIVFGPLGLTKMACGAEAMAVERAVTEVLAGTVDYTIEADALTLDAGATGLGYRSGADPA